MNTLILIIGVWLVLQIPLAMMVGHYLRRFR